MSDFDEMNLGPRWYVIHTYSGYENKVKVSIEKVLAMDYRALGRRILAEFKEYIEKVNEQNLKNAVEKKKK